MSSHKTASLAVRIAATTRDPNVKRAALQFVARDLQTKVAFLGGALSPTPLAAPGVNAAGAIKPVQPMGMPGTAAAPNAAAGAIKNPATPVATHAMPQNPTMVGNLSNDFAQNWWKGPVAAPAILGNIVSRWWNGQDTAQDTINAGAIADAKARNVQLKQGPAFLAEAQKPQGWFESNQARQRRLNAALAKDNGQITTTATVGADGTPAYSSSFNGTGGHAGGNDDLLSQLADYRRRAQTRIDENAAKINPILRENRELNSFANGPSRSTRF